MIEFPDGAQAVFPIDAFSKRCLLAGVDELGYLLNQSSAIAGYEARVPPRVQTNA
jgi:3-isopropylmalate/(R)-2-methylmalate dehydratase small subunit